MEKVDLHQLIFDIVKYEWDSPVKDDIFQVLEELATLRSENEAIKKNFKALFESRGNDYNNRIAALEDEIDKLEKVAEAAEIARRILKPQCSNYGGKMPCYCRSGTFEEGVAIEPPDQSPDCYMYEELDKALKEWKGE